jgi:hypothetical protein
VEASMTGEGLVKAQVKELLDHLKAYYFMPVQTGMGAKTLDFLCCVRGQFIGIETKKPRSKGPTKLQSLCIEEINLAGGQAFWCDNVIQCVNELGYHVPHQLIMKWTEQNSRAEAKRNRRR